jgi:hypothetical protein
MNRCVLHPLHYKTNSIFVQDWESDPVTCGQSGARTAPPATVALARLMHYARALGGAMNTKLLQCATPL